MKLWEAMKALEEGKKVRLKEWSEGCYIIFNEKGDIVDEEDELYRFNGVTKHAGWDIYDDRIETDGFIKNLYELIWVAFSNWTYYDEYIERHEILDNYIDKLYEQLVDMNKEYKLDK